MKYSILVILSVVILGLLWTALHDIIKGNEPDLTAEYAVLIFSFIFFVSLIFQAIRIPGKDRHT